MTLVQALVPRVESVPMSAALEKLTLAPVTEPFSPERVAFVSELSRALSRRGRGLPETQALAFWMRKAELRRLGQQFAALADETTLLMPRGTAFHIPPANVDTLFVYSLVLSLLVGNRNVVRLSARSTDQAGLILDCLRDVLQDHPSVAQTTLMLSYGHDRATTEAISGQCDIRVIWGGDSTVSAIRAIPLPPHATELAFPDRFSMAAIRTEAYHAASDGVRDDLTEKFFNDSYWFDQLGCSSPRLLLWVGESDPTGAAADFESRLVGVTQRKGYRPDTSAAIAKLGQSMRSVIDQEVSAYRAHSNAVTVLDVRGFPDVRGDFCGAGLFHSLHVATLADIVPHVQRMDQTLTAWGFDHESLRELARKLCGRGIDRIVPVGQALQFDRYWDGYDLLQSFTRRVSVTA